MTTFLVPTIIAGLIIGILGYVSFDKILYHSMRSASPSKQIFYIIILICTFGFGTAITIIGLFSNNANLSLLIASIFGIAFIFSIPGFITIFICYVLLNTGQAERISTLINETATPIIGLIVGFIVSMGISTSGFSDLQPYNIFNGILIIINFFKFIFGGFISAIAAIITKFILSSIW